MDNLENNSKRKNIIVSLIVVIFLIILFSIFYYFFMYIDEGGEIFDVEDMDKNNWCINNDDAYLSCKYLEEPSIKKCNEIYDAANFLIEGKEEERQNCYLDVLLSLAIKSGEGVSSCASILQSEFFIQDFLGYETASFCYFVLSSNEEECKNTEISLMDEHNLICESIFNGKLNEDNTEPDWGYLVEAIRENDSGKCNQIYGEQMKLKCYAFLGEKSNCDYLIDLCIKKVFD